MSGASRRRPPPRRGRQRDDYAGGPGYGRYPSQYGGGYEQGYDYEGYEPGYGQPYYPEQYGYDQDDWWDEGTGGMFSPVRLLLYLLVLGAGAVALYGMFFDRGTLQMPILVSGLAVLGLALVMLAWSSARGAANLGRRGYGGKAVFAALFGGFCAIGGFGSLAGALVLGMMTASI